MRQGHSLGGALVDCGAMCLPGLAERVAELVDDAVASGAQVPPAITGCACAQVAVALCPGTALFLWLMASAPGGVTRREASSRHKMHLQMHLTFFPADMGLFLHQKRGRE